MPTERVLDRAGEETAEPASLGCGSYSEQTEVKKVLQMKGWDVRWMFQIRVAALELGLEGVGRMGLVDEAVEFWHEIGGDGPMFWE